MTNKIKELFTNELFDKATKNIAFVSRVKDILMCLDELRQERALAYLLCSDVFDVDIALHSKPYDNEKDCTYESYNWLTNDVMYTYKTYSIKYFADEEEAKHFSNYGYTATDKYSKEKTDVYCIKGIFVNTYHSITSFDNWQSNAITNE